jgi:hypothetical protein
MRKVRGANDWNIAVSRAFPLPAAGQRRAHREPGIARPAEAWHLRSVGFVGLKPAGGGELLQEPDGRKDSALSTGA